MALAVTGIAVPAKGVLASQAIGSPAAGCVAEARSLPLFGHGYQVLRPDRARFWAHSDTVAFVEGLADAAAKRGLGTVLVGDMGQARGGPMPSGHASHQNGLDVDIWFRLPNKPLSAAELARPEPVSMVSGARTAKAWTTAQAELVERAARDSKVDRIFVNPVIKQALCATAGEGDDRSWLGRLRPWWGHDEHFHVRLACPPDSPGCEAQRSVPEGDGCGEELASWLARPTVPAPPERPHVQRRPLPDACQAVLGKR